MEFHKTLRKIVTTYCPNILKEGRLINILDNLNAYQDMPAYKQILRAIIADGYTSKLLTLGKWNCAAEALSYKFVAQTGFDSRLVSQVGCNGTFPY